MSDHVHEWVDGGNGWRICACLLVQRHDGKRWRKAPREIQALAHCAAMMIVLSEIASHPALVTGPLAEMGRALRILTAP